MIRLVRVGDQIRPDSNQFSWYDTVRGRYLTFNDSNVWDSWESFVQDYNAVVKLRYRDIDRYKHLYNNEPILIGGIHHPSFYSEMDTNLFVCNFCGASTSSGDITTIEHHGCFLQAISSISKEDNQCQH